MGWVTNIYFPEGLELNDTKIRPGMSTQVRWDIGIGEITFDNTGKIVAEGLWHGYPLHLQEKEAYQLELSKWTGIFDTNMGVLFVKEGQLCHLDLSYEGIGEWIVNNGGFDWQPTSDKNNLCRTMPVSAFEHGEMILNDYREKLLGNVTPFDGGYAFSLAQEAYQKRSGEIIDMYYKERGNRSCT